MSSMEGPRFTEGTGDNSWVGPALGIIALLAVLAGAIVALIPDTKAEEALHSYQKALRLCGAGNVQKHEYTNGTSDFDCKDYAQVK